MTLDGRRVFVSHAVFDSAARLQLEHHPDETGGLLFGRLFTDGTHPCALVTDLITPQSGEVLGTPTAVTITADGAKEMKRRARRATPCADALGWAHTHPRFPAYFSGTDQVEQWAWTEPASVGLVISGLASADPRCRVFVGPESTPAEPAVQLSPRRSTPALRPQAEPVGAYVWSQAPIAHQRDPVSWSSPVVRRRQGAPRSSSARRGRIYALMAVTLAIIFPGALAASWVASEAVGDETRGAGRPVERPVEQTRPRGQRGGGGEEARRAGRRPKAVGRGGAGATREIPGA